MIPEVRLLSMWEPWSTLVGLGAKKIETRNFSTPYRGLVAIHSTRNFEGDGMDCSMQPTFIAALYPTYGPCQIADWRTVLAASLPFSRVHAVGVLADCMRSEDIFRAYPTLDSGGERAFGNYSPYRYGWVFSAVFRLKAPIFMRGCQGMRPLEPVAATKVIAQIEEQGDLQPLMQALADGPNFVKENKRGV